MTYFTVTEDKFKLIVASRLFVGPADYNYIHARFCRAVGLHNEFSWQCLQAIEKYFKAGLILNNIPIKGFSHNLPRLLQSHRDIYNEFSVVDPVRPESLNEELWKERTLDDLVERIHYFGHPDSRYGLRSYINHPSDLFLLDTFVFELRRRIGRLESVVGTDIYANGEAEQEVLEQCRGKKFSHLITAFPRFQLFEMNVPNINFADIGEGMEDALYHWNFLWARNDDDLRREPPRTVSSQFGGFGNSLLFMLRQAIEKPDHSSESKAAIHDRMEWLFAHVPLGRGVEEEMRGLLPAQTDH